MPLKIHELTTAVAATAALATFGFGATMVSAAADLGLSSTPTVQHMHINDPSDVVVTKQNYDQVMESSKQHPVFLFFFFPACGGCQEVDPVITKFNKDDAGKWVLGRVNTDHDDEIAQKYHIPGCPTMIVVKNGKEVDRKVAYNGQPKSLRDWLDTALAKPTPQH